MKSLAIEEYFDLVVGILPTTAEMDFLDVRRDTQKGRKSVELSRDEVRGAQGADVRSMAKHLEEDRADHTGYMAVVQKRSQDGVGLFRVLHLSTNVFLPVVDRLALVLVEDNSEIFVEDLAHVVEITTANEGALAQVAIFESALSEDFDDELVREMESTGVAS